MTKHLPAKSTDVSDSAPVLFFDSAPASGAKDGVIGITLVAARHLPIDGGKVVMQFGTVAHLRCSVASALELRNAIDRALTLMAPQGALNKN